MAEISADAVLRARLGLLRGSLLTVQHALTDLEACRTGSRNDLDGDEEDDEEGAVPDGGEEDDEEGAAPALGEGGSGEANAAGTPDRAITAKALRREIVELDLTNDVRVRISALIDQLEAAGGAPAVEVLRPQLLALDKTSLDGSLRDEVTTELQNLERVAGLVAMAEAEPEQAAKDQRLAEAWTAYRACRADCERLFSEYVDLVRGVLLRDALFDQDICRIADELVRLFGQVKEYIWNAFTIPSTSERRDASFARLIRIGFPEWNVWTLPLTAHEFGHVFAARHELMQELIGATAAAVGIGPDEVKGWVADAYATTVMGPAYMWAAMLLRIDPTAELDRRRVEVMRLTLALVSGQGPSAYGSAVERVGQAWADALAQTGPWEPTSPELVAAMADVATKVSARVREPFGSMHWDMALVLVDDLRNPASSPRKIARDLQPTNLRHVLAAGWYARVELAEQRTGSSGDVEAQQEAISNLAERVRRVCLQLVAKASDVASPGSGAPDGARLTSGKSGKATNKEVVGQRARASRAPG